MSREIKFRAWHEQGFMLDVENIVKLNLEEEILEYCVLNEDGVRSDRECSFYEIELMQYTGIKDKNGVEIYEGDIIKTDLERPYLIVEYRNGAFMLNCNDGSDDYYDIFFGTLEELKEVCEYSEVIGNIHDNPELM